MNYIKRINVRQSSTLYNNFIYKYSTMKRATPEPAQEAGEDFD